MVGSYCLQTRRRVVHRIIIVRYSSLGTPGFEGLKVIWNLLLELKAYQNRGNNSHFAPYIWQHFFWEEREEVTGSLAGTRQPAPHPPLKSSMEVKVKAIAGKKDGNKSVLMRRR